MTVICTISHAKLNLFLHIIGKRTDGYHNIQSVFVRIAFGDEMRFALWQGENYPLADNQFIYLNSPFNDNIHDNLIVKASDALIHYAHQHHIRLHLPKIAITLNKHIAIGAGLGGGSSNAAYTLMALNHLWQLKLPKCTLMTIAQSIGADVPFFIKNTTNAIVEGIGEQITPIPLPNMYYLILNPCIHHRTGDFFAHAMLNKNSTTISHDDILHYQTKYIATLQAPFYNAFENIALNYPQVMTAYDYLQQIAHHTQSTPRLTGTGSSVFLPIMPQHLPNSNKLTQWIAKAPCPALLTHSI